MKDFVTNAYTLRVVPSRDFDKTAHLFTEDFGKIEVRVVSGRKILSKFSPHLEPVQRVSIRLAKRSGFTLTDVLSNDLCNKTKNDTQLWSSALKSFSLIHALAPREVKDERLWDVLEEMNKTGVIQPKEVLSCLGYDVYHAACDICGAQSIVGFDMYTQLLLCVECVNRTQESRVVIL